MSSAKPNSVLVVEDEAMVAVLLEDFLQEELGHRVAASSGDLDEALRLATEETFDLAILDVGIKHRMSVPIADVLAARGTPFVVVTVYDREFVLQHYPGAVMIPKPINFADLAKAIEFVLAAQASKDGTAPGASPGR